MITQRDIHAYTGRAFSRGDTFLYLPPHPVLRPYISCYTLSFPAGMPDAYTILPSASATMVFHVHENGMTARLRGVDTQPNLVGAQANKMRMLLLVEFRPGCLTSFLRTEPSELLDRYIPLDELHRSLPHVVEDILLSSKSIDGLTASLDRTFIHLLTNNTDRTVSPMLAAVVSRGGHTGTRELSAAFYYSEKHIRRLFLRQVGISPKHFARIVRINHALCILRSTPARLADVAVQTGFFDQPHFIHDFKAVCGVTPIEYTRNMSVFYNDDLKLRS